jgi:hypothetical protein
MVLDGNVVADELERRLLASESSDFGSDMRATLLTTFERQLSQQLGKIRLPSERSIRLTARNGEIPVSVQNDTGYPVKLRVELSSDKLEFPESNVRDLIIDHQSATVPVAIDARTSGAFPVQLRLVSPDGKLEVATSRVTVRSTSASGIGLGISIGAGAFLVLWWGRSIWKNQRKRAHHMATT